MMAATGQAARADYYCPARAAAPGRPHCREQINKIPERDRMKLLIIEENAALRRLITSLIGGLRLSVTECDDGAQALAAYAAVQPDWVLLDLACAEALPTLRQLTATHADARVVVVADEDNSWLRDAAQRAGACAYVLKENLLEMRLLLQVPKDSVAQG